MDLTVLINGPLAVPARAFVDGITSGLAEVAAKPVDEVRPIVAAEAAEIAGAVVDADREHTDAELRAYLAAFSLVAVQQLAGFTSPDDLRSWRLLEGKRHWVEQPSKLLELLVDTDRRYGTRLSHRYYHLAFDLAQETAGVELTPSREALGVLDRLRSTVLRAMDAGGVPRVGRPPTGPAPSEPAAGATAASSEQPGAAPAAASTPEDEPRPLDELLAELDDLVGLAEVKEEVRRLANLISIQRVRAERGLPVIDTSRHLVFAGNPGTGKTTVARIVAQIYRTLGVVPEGHLVEADRSQLVAGYVGQTATKTRAVIEAALGGVLLIDEAYALARGGENDFGREAIDTLVKMMEDHRDDLAVIAAGYTDEMRVLLDTNPGLRSRFPIVIEFADYSDDELVEIFRRMGEKHRYVPDERAIARLREILAAMPRGKAFGNARLVRNLFEQAVTNQATRLIGVASPTDEQLGALTADDLEAPEQLAGEPGT